MSALSEKLQPIFKLFARSQEVARKLPLHKRPEIERISRGLPEFAPRLMKKRGPGTEFFEVRPYNHGDDPRRIHPRQSAKKGHDMVIEKEAEISQHFYIWRDMRTAMNFESGKAPYTPRDAADIMILAIAKHLARYDEKVGLIDGDRLLQGGRAAEMLAAQMAGQKEDNSGNLNIRSKLVQHSTALLFSDFMMPPETLEKSLSRLQKMGIGGWLIMVADPQLIEFEYTGDVLFYGPCGEGEKQFDRADSKKLRSDYRKALKGRLDWLETTAKSKGFELIIQRTDQDLHQGLRALYNIAPKIPESIKKMEV